MVLLSYTLPSLRSPSLQVRHEVHAVAVGDGPGGVLAAGASHPAFPGAEFRIPSYIQTPGACFRPFSIACGNTAGTDNCNMVSARSELLSRCG